MPEKTAGQPEPKKSRKGLQLYHWVAIALLLGVALGWAINGPGQWEQRVVYERQVNIAEYKIRQAEREGREPAPEALQDLAQAEAALEAAETPAWSSVTMEICRTAGQLFLRLIKMIVVPLIFFSIVYSVANLGDMARLSRIGWKTVLYYTCTTGMAVLLGLVLVNIIQPGVGANNLLSSGAPEAAEAGPPTPTELLLRIVPDNPIRAMAETDSLQIIFFALCLGVALGVMGKKARVVVEIAEVLMDAMIVIVHWILKLLPFAVLALMARAVGQAGISLILQLAKYMLTVVLGLAIHGYVVLLAALWIFARIQPWRFVKGVAPALITSFSTASSSATLPITMEECENKVGIKERITSFVCPLGATINMDGTALYESVAAMFIAQAYGIELSLGEQVMVFLTATLAAIGAAGIPEAGLVTMAIVLRAVGLPLEGIGIIVAVDRVLDMCRTSVNVLGDCIGAAIVARSEGELDEDILYAEDRPAA
jgi:Na+/H+-dicarboxylate symporter